YNMTGELPVDGGPLDITSAAVRRPGDDVSIVTHGGSLWKVLEAAEALAAEGISTEVIDLRSLRPLDADAIIGSVSRTHRLVVVDEGWKTLGLSSEIVAMVAEDALWELDAPIARVCGVEVPIPYAKHLEAASIPQVDGIIRAVHEVVGR
ncbi:MAG: transketolase C-terminal domain-containing protein, partial [Acidimicrobiia bacterium]